MKKSEYKKYFPYVLFGLYILFVLWLTLLNRKNGINRSTLTPFWEYAKVIRNQGRKYFIGQIIGNIALFIPLGFMLPFLPKFKNVNCTRVLLIGLCFSIIIELTQYITGRGLMEFDDVFNNTLGAMISYGVYKMIDNLFSVRCKRIE